MKIKQTKLKDAIIIEPKVHGDYRGWFYESYSSRELQTYGLRANFVQDNRAFSRMSGTLRGLHCQVNPMAQAKLVSCLRGAILDVAVDVREGSPTYLQHLVVKLTAENRREFFIPRGFLHGYVTLEDNTEVFYKVDQFYDPASDRSVRYDDPALGINWGVNFPVLSNKDVQAPCFAESHIHFQYLDVAPLVSFGG